MYKGYWVWHISLSNNVVSIGVEFNRRELHLPLQDRDRGVTFLESHRAPADILEPAELLDFSAYVELPALRAPVLRAPTAGSSPACRDSSSTPDRDRTVSLQR